MSISPTVKAVLDDQIVGFRQLAYLDFNGDPLRATDGPYDKSFSGTGDAYLDGFTFESISHKLISISDPVHNESGSDSVVASMSGLVVNDASFLSLIGNKSNWQGRIAVLWWYMVDQSETMIGNPIVKYVGYMNDLTINGDPDSQTVAITIENYLNAFSAAPNRTYAQQKEYDSTDESPSVFASAANGNSGGYNYAATNGSTIERGNVNLR